MTRYFNPYYDQTFFGFFKQLFLRSADFFKGNLSIWDLTSDEVQIFVLASIAASGALVGSFLILRRMTMLANSLSHTILIGIVAVYLLTSRDPTHAGVLNIQAMLLSAVVTGLTTAFLTEFLIKTAKLQSDASIGLVFTSLFALGIVMVSVLTRDAHVGVEVVMGNADALQIEDCFLAGIILLINSAIFVLFFKEFKLTTFDPNLAKALGFSTVFFDYLLMAQVSITSVGAFRAVGVLMVLAFLTGPPLIAKLFLHQLRAMVWTAMGIGSFSAFIGVAISRHLLTVYGVAVSTAGICVCVIIGLYLLAVAAYFIRKKISFSENTFYST